MAFYQPSYTYEYEPAQPSLVPLFRLLNEWENANTQAQAQAQLKRAAATTRAQRFSPNFDARETETAYELYGELPGAVKENINIEFTDPQTIVISGKVERKALPFAAAASSSPLPEANQIEAPAAMMDVDNKEEVVKAQPQEEKVEEEQGRYLLQERTTGEFQRVFSFPGLVDQDGVHASLENGILSVRVPKKRIVLSKGIWIH
ncbi:30 kDa heat shock protein [Cladorrhinum sp. PSN259]|nr:30 kDa heat shock protein [Cladorrhinum sp. PSN259]